MQLTSSAKGTVAFSVALAIAIAYCTTNSICMSEQRSAVIPTFGKVFGPLVNGSVVAPLTIVLMGFVVFGIWTSRRSAYAIALALGAISVVIYTFSGLAYLLAGSFASVFICASVITSAALVAGYAVMGWREAQSGERSTL
jgi:hypothetical protein